MVTSSWADLVPLSDAFAQEKGQLGKGSGRLLDSSVCRRLAVPSSWCALSSDLAGPDGQLPLLPR